MNTLRLRGCKAEPLLSYLAGLGVVRLATEQLDPEVSAYWQGDHLVIESEFDDSELVEFFVRDYKPTPLIAPWNASGGFQDGRKRFSEEIIGRIELTDSERLSPYRKAIKAARNTWEKARKYKMIECNVTKDGKVVGKVAKKHKLKFIELCRSTFPDEALSWLDASVILLDDKETYPLILGTGGNLGRMDFSSNFLRCLKLLGIADDNSDSDDEEQVCSEVSHEDRVGSLVRNALFDYKRVELDSVRTGQFDPSGGEVPNSSSGDRVAFLANPWAFVLAMEGAVVFACAAARKLSSEGQSGNAKASMPFTVDSTAAGYESVSVEENPKGELWVPLWRAPLSYREISYLISEGRSQWGRKQSKSGLDFVRAIATLGVDRSIDQFVRYLISKRRGDSFIATPIGRFEVSPRVRIESELLRQLDLWVDSVRSTNSPPMIKTAVSALERAQFEVARFGGASRLQAVLTSLAEVEQAISRSPKYQESNQNVNPVSGLSASCDNRGRCIWVDGVVG